MRTLRSLVVILAVVVLCSAVSRLSLIVNHESRYRAVASGGDPIPQCTLRHCPAPNPNGR